MEIEASNAPPHVPPLEEITVAPDVEVGAAPIAEPSLGIPTVAAMAAAYEEAASGAAAQPAAANSSAPVLGPQLVKNVRPTPAVKSFAKPTPRKANRRAVTYGGWRKRSGWMKRTLRGPFYIYMREVAESFVRDWRHFAASFTSQMSTFPRITLAGSGSLRHSVIEPIREWLAKPMSSRTNPPGPRSSSSATERQRKS